MKNTREQVIHVRVSDEDYSDLKRLVEAEGTTVSALLRQNIRNMTVQSEITEWE